MKKADRRALRKIAETHRSYNPSDFVLVPYIEDGNERQPMVRYANDPEYKKLAACQKACEKMDPRVKLYSWALNMRHWRQPILVFDIDRKGEHCMIEEYLADIEGADVVSKGQFVKSRSKGRGHIFVPVESRSSFHLQDLCRDGKVAVELKINHLEMMTDIEGTAYALELCGQQPPYRWADLSKHVFRRYGMKDNLDTICTTAVMDADPRKEYKSIDPATMHKWMKDMQYRLWNETGPRNFNNVFYKVGFRWGKMFGTRDMGALLDAGMMALGEKRGTTAGRHHMKTLENAITEGNKSSGGGIYRPHKAMSVEERDYKGWNEN